MFEGLRVAVAVLVLIPRCELVPFSLVCTQDTVGQIPVVLGSYLAVQALAHSRAETDAG